MLIGWNAYEADVVTDSSAYPDTICVKVWASMDMTILAHAIFGVLLDCSAASWQMRLQPQAHKYVSAGAPTLRKAPLCAVQH